ncbi:MAG: T9SS type A sorting domain-containing protein [Bacteroidales bacterium]|nr:T9SS type A sorting domain-containing protein [Bacteroidales bacterium]
MIKRPFLTLLMLLLASSLVAGQEAGDTAMLREHVLRYGQARVSVLFSGRDEAGRIGSRVPIDNIREGRLNLKLSIADIEPFLSLGIPFRVDDPPDYKAIITASDMSKALDWQTYPTHTQYDSIMRKFASDYPGLCRLDTIGTSILGRYVLVLKISDNVHINEEDEPEVFYSSTIHGDELAGFVLMLRLASYLLENYATDAGVSHLVNNLQIYINPLANPDGTYRTGDIISSPTRGNANGRDLNRNFPDPMSPGIVQEKETIDMMAFMKKHRFVLSANFHSGFEVVNYPWDRWSRLHADDEWFIDVCRAYADTVHTYSPLSYMSEFDNGVVRGSVWYIIYGGRQDYVTYSLQGREVTVELDYTDLTPAGELEDLWQYNHRSLLNYLLSALNGVRGRVTSALSGEPVEARVFIPGHDTDSSDVWSSPLSGNYNRLLNQGTWTFQFSAAGYRDTIITGIEVLPAQATFLDVAMEPVAVEEDTLTTDILLVFPNPSRGEYSVLLPESMEGEVEVEIVSSSGVYIAKQTIQYEAFTPFTLTSPRLASGVYILKARSLLTGRRVTGRVIIVR